MNNLTNSYLKKIIKSALKEDFGKIGDITSNSILSKRDKAVFHFVSREKGVLCGLDISEKVFEAINNKINFVKFKKDGDKIHKNEILAKVEGPAIDLLSGERTALNFMTHLSGIATNTSKLVKLIAKTQAQILCTRKTTPNLRVLEKYAVQIGGGYNHRFGLYDAILIKDNHIAISGSITKALKKVKKLKNNIKIEVEVDDLKQFEEVLEYRPDVILLDNFKIKDLRKAVKINKNRVFLEASGGINFLNVVKIAETGVDFISSGWITHSSPALDIGLDLIR